MISRTDSEFEWDDAAEIELDLAYMRSRHTPTPSNKYTDFTNENWHSFQTTRIQTNRSVSYLGTVSRTIDGRVYSVAIYSPGVAADGHLGSIPQGTEMRVDRSGSPIAR